MDQKIEQYNKLVDEWNSKYPQLATAIFVDQSDFCTSFIERIRIQFLSKEMTAKKKLKTTKTLLNPHKKIHYEAGKEDFTRGELAYTIIRVADDILAEL